MIFSSSQIAAVLGAQFKPPDIDANWPIIWAALDQFGIATPACEIATIATVAVETGCFRPIRERGGPGYFIQHYWENEHVRVVLGNTCADDAVKYRGRGYVQITGRANYQHFGKAIGYDLFNRPDDALLPTIAAEILAAYSRERHIPEMAAAGNWEKVRKAVNGGLNGWADFLKYVQALQSLIAPAESAAVEAAGTSG